MASPSTVLSQGYGSWGSVYLLPTLGFGIGGAAIGIERPCVTLTARSNPVATLAQRANPAATLTRSVPSVTLTKRGCDG
jgi:hypothetical protein